MNDVRDEERDTKTLLNNLHAISDSESELSSNSEALDNEFEAKLGSSPGDFITIKSKEWWMQLQTQLEKETERQLLAAVDEQKDSVSTYQTGTREEGGLLESPSPTRTTPTRVPRKNTIDDGTRTRRKSWLENRDKITSMLEEAAQQEPSLSHLQMSSSSESMISNVSESSSVGWWEMMKESLEKEDKPSLTPSTSAEINTSNESSKSDWWSQMTADLDKETGSQTVTPQASPLKPFQTQMERSRSTSMSASFGRVEEDSGGTLLRIYNGIYRGETSIGQDNNAVAHGVGTFTAANGELYVGQWHHGKRHGKGLRTWKDGKEYIGDWENNKRTGNGLLTSGNGDIYIGGTQYGFQQGHGMMAYANGDKYIGDWNVGERHGYGVMFFKSGDAYYGDWNRNKKDGYGIYKSSDAKIKEGTWKDNKFVGPVLKKQEPNK